MCMYKQCFIFLLKSNSDHEKSTTGFGVAMGKIKYGLNPVEQKLKYKQALKCAGVGYVKMYGSSLFPISSLLLILEQHKYSR